MAKAPGFLVVEDEPELARGVARQIRLHRDAEVVHTVREARIAFRVGNYIGLVLDIGLPDGSGLDFLAELRSRGVGVSALILTGELTRDFVNRAQELGAEYVCKPATRENLETYVRSAIELESGIRGRIAPVVKRLAQNWELTPREQMVLEYATEGLSRRDLADRMGVKENTVKSQTRSLLRKSGARSLATLAQEVLKLAAR